MMHVCDDDVATMANDASELPHHGAEVGHMRQRERAHNEVHRRVRHGQLVEIAEMKFGARDLRPATSSISRELSTPTTRCSAPLVEPRTGLFRRRRQGRRRRGAHRGWRRPRARRSRTGCWDRRRSRPMSRTPSASRVAPRRRPDGSQAQADQEAAAPQRVARARTRDRSRRPTLEAKQGPRARSSTRAGVGKSRRRTLRRGLRARTGISRTTRHRVAPPNAGPLTHRELNGGLGSGPLTNEL